jgi:hypothetical protein
MRIHEASLPGDREHEEVGGNDAARRVASLDPAFD